MSQKSSALAAQPATAKPPAEKVVRETWPSGWWTASPMPSGRCSRRTARMQPPPASPPPAPPRAGASCWWRAVPITAPRLVHDGGGRHHRSRPRAPASLDLNDVASLEPAADAAGTDLAAIIVTGFRRDHVVDQELATPEFARAARALCDRPGSRLIIDEVRAGSCESLGVRPTAWNAAAGRTRRAGPRAWRWLAPQRAGADAAVAVQRRPRFRQGCRLTRRCGRPIAVTARAAAARASAPCPWMSWESRRTPRSSAP